MNGGIPPFSGFVMRPPLSHPCEMGEVEQKDSIEHLIEALIDHPEDLESIQQALLNDRTPSQAFIAFLDRVSVERVYAALPASMHQLQSVVSALDADAYLQFVKKHPILFAALIANLSRVDAELGREVIVRCIREHPREWREAFWKVFEALCRQMDDQVDTSLTESQPGVFVRKVLVAFSDTSLRSSTEHYSSSWVKFCARQASHDQYFALFVLILTHIDRRSALRAYLQASLVDHSRLLNFLEEVSRQESYNRLAARETMRWTITKLSLAGRLNGVEEAFHLTRPSSFGLQVSLLDGLPGKKCAEILKVHGSNISVIARWMEGLFHYYPDFTSRKKSLERIYYYLPRGKVMDLLYALHAQDSAIVPYFFFILCEEEWDALVIHLDYRVRSKLLRDGINDATRGELLREIGRILPEVRVSICEEMRLDVANGSVLIDTSHPLSLEDCFEQVLRPLVGQKEFADTYAPLIQNIPPLLIGVAVLSSVEKWHVLQSLAHLLTNPQLQFFIASCFQGELPLEEVIRHTLEPLGMRLREDQFSVVLEALTLSQMQLYTTFKSIQLQDIYEKFLEEYRRLDDAFTAFILQQSIKEVDYQNLKMKVLHLHQLARRPDAIDYRCLLARWQCLASSEPLHNESLADLNKAMQCLKERQALFVGTTAWIPHQMEAIAHFLTSSRDEEEEDLTRVLYPGFWILMRNEVLPHLGISPHGPLGIVHAGQLPEVGIRTNRDLEYLGLSPEADLRWASCRGSMMGFLPFSAAIPAMEAGSKIFALLWDKWATIAVEQAVWEITCRELLQILLPRAEQMPFARMASLELCELLMQIDGSDRKWMEWREEIEAHQGADWSVERLALFLGEALNSLRGYHPLCRLQRYLLHNHELRASWQILSSCGCRSIGDLFDKGWAKDLDDLLRLHEIAAHCDKDRL